jgi:hypothetical protein
VADEVARKEAELAQAKLAAAYDEAVETYRNDPSDENKAAKDDLANQLVAARQAVRQDREAEAASLAEGVARPEAIEALTEVGE